MVEWFNSLSETVKAAAVGATIGAIVALVSLLFKDWIFQLLSENRKLKKERKDAFKKYSSPVILSCVSLAFRIQEIFEDRGHFLLNNTPKDPYNKYKYISTLYRICSLLGWLRASKREMSFVEVRQKRFKTIEKALHNFENCLANGTHVEVSRVKHLCREWDLSYDSMSLATVEKLGIEIEHVYRKYVWDREVQLPSQLDCQDQEELLIIIADLICRETQNEKIKVDKIIERQNSTIKEISRIESWIYRDWQLAIGDMMIVERVDASGRKYDVIGYGEFECLYETLPENQKHWIERIDMLFRDLNVTVDDRFDARVLQLKNIYSSVLEIIETYVSIQGYACISRSNLRKLQQYRDKLAVQV